MDCFYFLPVMNTTSVNTCVKAYVYTYIFIFPGYTPRSRIAGSYGNSIPDCFPGPLHHFTTLPAVCEGLNFFPSSTKTCHYLSFDYSHATGCEVISHCGFDLHLPDD